MLYNVNIVYDNGQATNEIIHSVTLISLYTKRDNIKSAVVSVHKYEVEGSFHPGLLQLEDGKKYIIEGGVKKFCKEIGVTYDAVLGKKSKNTKGWTIINT